MKKFFIFAAFVIAMTGCSNEEIIPQESLKDTPITITAGVAELTTRAGYAGTTNLPGTFYFSIDQDETDYDYTNVKMSKGDANAYTPEASIYWAGGSTTPSVNAYTTQGETFSVQTDQSTDDGIEASDLLGATSSDVTINDNNINITFRHLLCKLDVTYSWGGELNNATSKSIKSVQYEGFGMDATLNHETSAITVGSTIGSIFGYVNDIKSEAIFAPQTSNPKIVIVATIDGVDRTFSIKVVAPSGGFVAGNSYTMNITIGSNVVNSVDASIASGWGEIIQGDNMTTN